MPTTNNRQFSLVFVREALSRPPATDLEKALFDLVYLAWPNVHGMDPISHRNVWELLQKADPRPELEYHFATCEEVARTTRWKGYDRRYITL